MFSFVGFVLEVFFFIKILLYIYIHTSSKFISFLFSILNVVRNFKLYFTFYQNIYLDWPSKEFEYVYHFWMYVAKITFKIITKCFFLLSTTKR